MGSPLVYQSKFQNHNLSEELRTKSLSEHPQWHMAEWHRMTPRPSPTQTGPFTSTRNYPLLLSSRSGKAGNLLATLPAIPGAKVVQPQYGQQNWKWSYIHSNPDTLRPTMSPRSLPWLAAFILKQNQFPTNIQWYCEGKALTLLSFPQGPTHG